MKKITTLVVAMAGLAFGGQANAHISFRDLGVSNPFQRSLTSNIGWADAADGNQGDSHHGAWFSFTLTELTQVKITASALAAGTYPTLNGSGVQTVNSTTGVPNTYTAGTLSDIGFSLYSGLWNAPGGAAYENAGTGTPKVLWYDFAANGYEGGWDAIDDSTLWNDAGVSKTLDYIASVNSRTDGVESLVISLAAGSYSIGIGGAIDPDALNADHGGVYGVQAQINAVPVPGAVWLFGSAIAGMIGFNRRKQIAA